MSEANVEYSREHALRFSWSSVVGTLNDEREKHLRKYLCGKVILDAGCGGGGYVEHLAAGGYEVTGLEKSADMLTLARERAQRGTYVEGDVTAMPFPDQSFDCTYCFDVLEHVDDAAALRELLRVTRDRVILAVPATDQNQVECGLTFRHYQDLTHLRTYTRESLAALLQAAGQHRFEIWPELAVDLRGVAIRHLDLTIGSGWRGALRKSYHAILRRMLMHANYRAIYSGLVAVVESQPNGNR